MPQWGRIRGPGGVVGGLDSVSWAKGCARELASVALRCLQGPSRGIPWPLVDDETDDIDSSKVSNTTLGP